MHTTHKYQYLLWKSIQDIDTDISRFLNKFIGSRDVEIIRVVQIFNISS